MCTHCVLPIVVRENLAVLPRQFDQHLALRVINPAGGRGLETDEGLEVWEPGSIKVDVMDDCTGQDEQEQRQGGGYSPASSINTLPCAS
ncbi:MAG: hypothetical protein P8020_19805 [Acidobacteriota bacterium]